MMQLQQVLWTRGVLLAPQHLQAHDRFLEDSLQFKLSALTCCRWGFEHLDIDAEAIAAGELSLRAGSGVFPDGLVFNFPSADLLPPPKPIRDLWAPDQSSLMVYLAIPEYRDGGRNLGLAMSDPGARYVAGVVSRRDENTGETEKRLEIARKNMRLVAASESRDGHSTLPVARILRAANGGLSLDTHYVPPLLRFSGSPYLISVARGLVERLSAVSRDLSGVRRQRNQSLADFGSYGALSFAVLYTVNSHLPVIRHLLETRQGHPAQLFEAMLGLAGSLTTFSAGILAQDLPDYDHSDLSQSFAALERDVIILLEGALPTRCISLGLEPRDEGTIRAFGVALTEDRHLNAEDLYLAIETDRTELELLDRMPGLKAGSLEQVRDLVHHARRGLSLTHVPIPPSSVRVKPKHSYFRLERAGESWEQIRRSRTFAVHAPSGLEQARFELVIVLPTE